MKLTVGLLCVVLLIPAVASAQATVTRENWTWNWVDMVWNDPDTVGCLGEALILNGRIHVLTMETTSPSGMFEFRYHYQPQNLEVVGATSGDRYHAEGVTQGGFKTGGVNYPLYVEQYINTAPIVKPGSGFMLNVRMMFHVTITPKGATAASLDIVDVRCK